MSKTLMIAVCGALLVWASNGHAQQSKPAQAPQQAAVQKPDPQMVDPNSIVIAAMRTAQLIDGGRAGEVWDGASVIAKHAVTRDAFSKQIASTRTSLGTPEGRAWWSVTHQQVPAGGQMPAGIYISVRLATRFPSRTATELVTFRLDEDQTWRVAGYVLQ